jgi:hypothetical protein
MIRVFEAQTPKYLDSIMANTWRAVCPRTKSSNLVVGHTAHASQGTTTTALKGVRWANHKTAGVFRALY